MGAEWKLSEAVTAMSPCSLECGVWRQDMGSGHYGREMEEKGSRSRSNESVGYSSGRCDGELCCLVESAPIGDEGRYLFLGQERIH